MNKRVSVLGTPIDNLNMQETLDRISRAIHDCKHLHHTVVNAGKIVSMQKDPQLRESVVNADIINADGQGVVWASRLLGRPLKERVAGIDLMEQLVEVAYRDHYKVFFLGAKEDIVKSVVDHYSKIYSPEIIAGYRNGYFKKEDERDIARQIADSGANILFVAISSPTKENFLFQNREILQKVNFIMGVGGSFDVVSGLVKRAPDWMQKAGLEWLYRVYQEPKRMFRRYLVGNTKFILLVLKYKFKGRPAPAPAPKVV
jgi:N-acetylglucosaminyldiphosphoundecaprenol N-acetyl-beta-D-mannosaminyltransferase